MANQIVKAAIHPAIGICRVGSSRDFLLAPQVPDPPSRPLGTSHDAGGDLKREAVEFRVYGFDNDDNVIAELDTSNAQITWTVHIANAKAAWFKFRHAMDVPSLADTVVERRNPKVKDAERRDALVIDPGPRSISGRGKAGSPAHIFDTGTFNGEKVYLGELRTDQNGRLLVLPGYGHSSSPTHAPPYIASDTDAFGNAAGWHDDIADGTVDAEVTIGGMRVPTLGAWVASAPPNYAPDLKSWRTLYDLVVDVYVRAGWLGRKATTSFTQDVYPTLARLSALQWVNKASAALFGHAGPFDFCNPLLIDRVCRVHDGDVHHALRMSVARFFRSQKPYPSDPEEWPWLYGDAFGSTSRESSEPYLHLSLEADSERQRHLSNWVKGEFEADWGKLAPPLRHIDDYPLSAQPAALDRAALDFCVADAFHPGIEFTWPMRHVSIYERPFRIRRAMHAEPDYGPTLDVARALGPDGPLHGQFPGSLTRWMLLPWQIDTGGCLAGYDTGVSIHDAPSFWPTRVPNFVLSQENYRRLTDPAATEEQRMQAFQARRHWFHVLGTPATNWGERLVKDFGRMGVVQAHPGPGGATLPEVVYAETRPHPPQPPAPTPPQAAGVALAQPASQDDRAAQAAGFASESEREAMRRMRFGR